MVAAAYGFVEASAGATTAAAVVLADLAGNFQRTVLAEVHTASIAYAAWVVVVDTGLGRNDRSPLAVAKDCMSDRDAGDTWVEVMGYNPGSEAGTSVGSVVAVNAYCVGRIAAPERLPLLSAQAWLSSSICCVHGAEHVTKQDLHGCLFWSSIAVLGVLLSCTSREQPKKAWEKRIGSLGRSRAHKSSSCMRLATRTTGSVAIRLGLAKLIRSGVVGN